MSTAYFDRQGVAITRRQLCRHIYRDTIMKTTQDRHKGQRVIILEQKQMNK